MHFRSLASPFYYFSSSVVKVICQFYLIAGLRSTTIALHYQEKGCCFLQLVDKSSNDIAAALDDIQKFSEGLFFMHTFGAYNQKIM